MWSEPTLLTSVGSCFGGPVTWTDALGAPIDLLGRTLSIVDASHPALEGVTHTVVDAAAGVSRIDAHEDITVALGVGRLHSFRLAISDVGGCPRTSPRLWVDVE